MTENARLVQRLSHLEAQVRWIKKIGAAATLVVAAVLIAGQAPAANAPKAVGTVPNVLIAKEFRLIDDKGRERASLGMRRQLRTSGVDEFVALEMFDEKSTKRLFLSVEATTGMGVVHVGSEKNKVRLVSMGSNGSGIIANSEGEMGFQLFTHWLSSSLTMRDQNAKTRLEIAVDRKSGANIALLDAFETRRAVLGTTSLEKVSTGAVTRTAESSLALFDKDSKLLFQAPPDR